MTKLLFEVLASIFQYLVRDGVSPRAYRSETHVQAQGLQGTATSDCGLTTGRLGPSARDIHEHNTYTPCV
jgi:hypothetical protein